MRAVVLAFLSFLFSQAIAAETDRFSLAALMQELGYQGRPWLGVPIRSEDDFKRALDGRLKPEETVRHEWPFQAFAANGPLNLAALALDDRSFDKTNPRGTVAIVEIPRHSGGQPRLAATTRITRDHHVGTLEFVSDSLVRIGHTWSAEPDPLNLGYLSDYTFFDADSGHQFSLLHSQPIAGLISVRAFGPTLYIGARKIGARVDYVIFTFNAVDKSVQELKTVKGSLGWRIFHDPVDEPGRDVWRLGRDHIEVLFSDGQDRWQMVWSDGRVVLGPLPTMPSKVKRIENTSEYMRIVRSDVLAIGRRTGGDLEPILYVRPGVSPFSHVRKVTAGFVAEEMDHPRYSHRLYTMDGEEEILVLNRLIQSDHKDGGLAGLSEQNKQTGEVFLVRSIYDPESLQAIVSQSQSASDLCETWLTGLRKR